MDFAGLAPGYLNACREMPIRSLRLTTLSTPKIDLPVDPDEVERIQRIIWHQQHPWSQAPDEATLGRLVQAEIERDSAQPFWIKAGNAEVQFGFVATDWKAARSRPPSPGAGSIPYKFASDPTKSGVDVANAFQAQTVPLGGQAMAVADPSGAVPGSTAVPVDNLTFKLQPLTNRAGLPDTYLPRWVLTVDSLRVHLEAVERLTGTADAVPVTLHTAYLTKGLGMGVNPAGTYLKLTAKAAIAFGGARGGGLAQPQLGLEAVTSRQGVLAESPGRWRSPERVPRRYLRRGQTVRDHRPLADPG